VSLSIDNHSSRWRRTNCPELAFDAAVGVPYGHGMRIRIIDAFTDQPFRGNPAAVCVLDGDTWPDQDWIQQVAAEMNLSETVFSLPATDGADYEIRWFTPVSEEDLCGHATLATAHALHSDRGAPAVVRFNSRSGILVAHSFADGSITLDFPAETITETPALEGLLDALGVEPVAIYRTDRLGDFIVVVSDEDTVRSVAPDLGAIAEIARREDLRGVIVTAQATQYDFISRFFAPLTGSPRTR
jgi:PhzF family phenazine biosynthesis protein